MMTYAETETEHVTLIFYLWGLTDKYASIIWIIFKKW